MGKGDPAAFRKSSLMARSPPLAASPAPARSKTGDSADSAKRVRDPASPVSGPRGTLPKRSKATIDVPPSDTEEDKERALTRTESACRLGKLLDELHSLVHEKQVRHINIAMKSMIDEMRKLKSFIELAAEGPEEPREPYARESVCAKCSQTAPGGKPG
ncbi:hypothetical protein KR200_008661, partial [Drosophila serrata]